MGKIKLKGKYVIGYDGVDHVIMKNAELVYEDDSILYVGKEYEGIVDETIDVGNAVISPGFIDMNALGDIDHELVHLDIPLERKKTLNWSKAYFNERIEPMTEEEEAFKSLYAYTQLILNGITTAMPITSVLYKKNAETYEELEAAVHHAGKLGLRIYLGPSFQCGMDVVNENGELEVVWDEEEGRKGLERAVQFIKEYDGAYDGLIRGALEPERIENQTKENLINIKKYSKELGCPIKLHGAQGIFEYDTIYNKYGKTPIQFLNSIGFLGANVGIPHCHIVAGSDKVDKGEGDDLQILKETQTTVIHCPLVIGRGGSYLDSFAKYKRKGIQIAMGTDTFPPDFFQNIRVASMMSKMVEGGNSTDSTFGDMFRVATLGGAKFLGRKDLGRLSVGAKADIIVVSLEGMHIGPVDDPIKTMLVGGAGTDVVMSIINGRIVMKNREIAGINIEELKEKAQKYYDKMKLTYMDRSYEKGKTEKEFYHTSFKVME